MHLSASTDWWAYPDHAPIDMVPNWFISPSPLLAKLFTGLVLVPYTLPRIDLSAIALTTGSTKRISIRGLQLELLAGRIRDETYRYLSCTSSPSRHRDIKRLGGPRVDRGTNPMVCSGYLVVVSLAWS